MSGNQLIDRVEQVQSHLNSLKHGWQSDYTMDWFKKLAMRVQDCLTELERTVQSVDNKEYKEWLLLHAVQLGTTCEFLLKVLKEEADQYSVLDLSRKSAIDRLDWCLEGICEIATNQSTPPKSTAGSFVRWMDTTLELLESVDLSQNCYLAVELCEKIRLHIEEILAQAMAVLQVALKDDAQQIKSASTQILHDLEQLKSECSRSNSNTNICNLLLNVLTNKLYMLEKLVNSSVLRLSLKVFAENDSPLIAVQSMCENSSIVMSKRSSKLIDPLVKSFDLHVDRIMQIGLFAIACSTNTKLVIKIKSCLASLESLEGELIPALTVLFMEPTMEAHIHSSILVDFWAREVNKLIKYVYLIIDHEAFAKVTYEECKSKVDVLKKVVESSVLTNDLVSPVLQKSKVFAGMMDDSISELNLTPNSSLYVHLKDLRGVNRELEAAMELLLDDENNCKESSQRVLKRCQILVGILNNIWIVLKTDNEENIRDISGDIPEASEASSGQTNVALSDFVTKGQQLNNERNILYRTPHKGGFFNELQTYQKSTPLGLPLSSFRINKKLGACTPRKLNLNTTLNASFSSEDTMDLHITDILENLTDLSVS